MDFSNQSSPNNSTIHNFTTKHQILNNNNNNNNNYSFKWRVGNPFPPLSHHSSSQAQSGSYVAMLFRHPVRKTPDPISPGLPDAVSGPESPLERNPKSAMGWKKREADGVGLGIVAALDRSEAARCGWIHHNHVATNPKPHRAIGFFCGSPPAEKSGYRALDFLSRCNLCRKNLHGKDIYMYRGEKAFCSAECRYQQILSDEFQEKCGSGTRRPRDVAGTAYADERPFLTGIAAA